MPGGIVSTETNCRFSSHYGTRQNRRWTWLLEIYLLQKLCTQWTNNIIVNSKLTKLKVELSYNHCFKDVTASFIDKKWTRFDKTVYELCQLSVHCVSILCTLKMALYYAEKSVKHCFFVYFELTVPRWIRSTDFSLFNGTTSRF